MSPRVQGRVVPDLFLLAAAMGLPGCSAEPTTAPNGTPSPPSVGYVRASHEPAGLTPLADQPMSGRGIAGWARLPRALTFSTDPTAPLSPGGYARMTFPAGFAGGRAPGTTGTTSFSRRRLQELYVRTAFRVSPQWYGHPSTINKVLHFWTTRPQRNLLYLALNGAGSKRLALRMVCQGTPNDAACTRLMANTGASGTITRGRWHVVEVYLRLNHRGRADGVVRLWLDGVLTHDYHAVRLDAGAWAGVDWSPTWGGMRAVLAAPQTMDMDEVYVSGR